ncbi:hypothetical protein [Mesorhizobium sp. CAU 1741]|uniref:hypothetical protein n=1 Tax=Mesorhizobium sp. CAU 1741 TaxID=3140366 RepID=UPI00325A75A4
MRSFKRLSLAIAVSFVSSAAAADDLVFEFHNDSSYNVVELYASPSDVDNWEEDILGLDILASGDMGRVTIADGRRACEYDLRIVFEDGDVIEDTTDLCDTDSYTVHD